MQTPAVIEAPAPVGHNNPPSPFDEVKSEIETLFEEAKGWLDGAEVTTQGQADDLDKLKGLIREAEKKAETLRKEEVKPFDEGKAEVQARFAPLIADTKSVKGLTVMAREAINKALSPWLDKLDREKRATEAKAREEAEEAARKAQEAFRASASTDLAARQEAERLAEEAKQADIAARLAAKDKAHAKGGVGRATHLRSFYSPEITDHTAFAQWLWRNRQPEMRGFLDEMAQRLVAQNHTQTIPGVTIHEERRAV